MPKRKAKALNDYACIQEKKTKSTIVVSYDQSREADLIPFTPRRLLEPPFYHLELSNFKKIVRQEKYTFITIVGGWMYIEKTPEPEPITEMRSVEFKLGEIGMTMWNSSKSTNELDTYLFINSENETMRRQIPDQGSVTQVPITTITGTLDDIETSLQVIIKNKGAGNVYIVPFANSALQDINMPILSDRKRMQLRFLYRAASEHQAISNALRELRQAFKWANISLPDGELPLNQSYAAYLQMKLFQRLVGVEP